jgi:hypothetical protein
MACDETIHVDICGDQPVEIDKLFGPLIFANLRVTADVKSNEWIIERQHIGTGEWSYITAIPGQIPGEFAE